MKTQNISKLLYGVGFLFLVYDSYQAYQTQLYWNIFKNAIFMGILIYMIWIYPKRKLYLNEDLMSILFLYFNVFSLKSFLEKAYLEMMIGLVYALGFIAYKMYRKRRKYSFNLYQNTGQSKDK